MAYLELETKEDSAEKLAAIAGKPSKNYLAAGEFNLVVERINALKTDLGDLTTKLTIYNNINTNTTAPLNSHLNIIGDCAITSPTPVAGKGYYEANVVNGIAVIDGVAYGSGSFITKSWLVASWVTNVIKKGVDNVDYSANRTITPQDNGDTIFMDSGTLTVNPSTQAYKNGHANAVMSSGIANTPLVLTAHTGWTYVINGATAVASASVNIEKGFTCTIIRKANLNIFYINGSII